MTKENASIFILAGEKSGDLHGARLVVELKKLMPKTHLWGVAGPLMRKEGMEALLPMEEFQMMGFLEPILKLPTLFKQFASLKKAILERNPEAVVLIDYPGFNLRLAAKLKLAGYKGKIIQYICPSVWAWKKNRIGQMVKTLDLLLTILPFEATLFQGTSLKIKYVGHPLVESLPEEYPSEKNLVAIFPGSRKDEIKRNLLLQIEAAQLLEEKHPNLHFAISCSQNRYETLIKEIMGQAKQLPKNIFLTNDDHPRLVDSCHLALAKSGTVTLELALRKKPSVVSYHLPWLYRPLAKWILLPRISYICIVNILAKKRVFPEFVTENFTAKDLYLAALDLVEGRKREECLIECQKVKETLGTSHASHEAAKAIQEAICANS